MACRALCRLLLPALLLVACSRPQPEAAAPPAAPSGGIGASPQAASAAPAEVPAAVPAAPAAVPVAPAGTVLASQDTNWTGIVAEVLELRRKGNTLTAKVRLRNTTGQDSPRAEVRYEETYLMDAANAKKYEVLRDEKGTYIAALLSGWTDRWYGELKPAGSYLLWMKFPAPPPEVTAVTLQVPNMPPFEDLAIQDN